MSAGEQADRRGQVCRLVVVDAYDAEQTAYDSFWRDPFELTVSDESSRRAALTHVGEEFSIVLQGRIRLEHDGHVHDLAPGDAAYYDATRPQRLVDPYDRAATALRVSCEESAVRSKSRRRAAR